MDGPRGGGDGVHPHTFIIIDARGASYDVLSRSTAGMMTARLGKGTSVVIGLEVSSSVMAVLISGLLLRLLVLTTTAATEVAGLHGCPARCSCSRGAGGDDGDGDAEATTAAESITTQGPTSGAHRLTIACRKNGITSLFELDVSTVPRDASIL